MHDVGINCDVALLHVDDGDITVHGWFVLPDELDGVMFANVTTVYNSQMKKLYGYSWVQHRVKYFQLS